MAKKTPKILSLDPGGDFFSHFFTHNPLPMWVFDITTLNFLEVNRAMTVVYGYSRAELLLMNIKDIRPREAVRELETTIEGLTPVHTDCTKWAHLKKDGTRMWVTIVSFEVEFNGALVRLVTANDVTAAYLQDLALYESNKELQEYKNAVTTSSIVSIAGRNGIIEYANDNFVKITGYSKEELVGSSHNIINSGYHPRSFWQGMWNTIMKGETWRGEVCNRKKNGSLYWVDSFIIPLTDRHGRVERIFSIRIDITERKNKEAEIDQLNKELISINHELEESKKELEKLSLVAQLTASAVMILDKNRRISWINNAFTAASGYTLPEVLGRLPEMVLHPNNPQLEKLNLIKETIKNKQPFHEEVAHYSKYGQESFWITDGQPVLDAQGNVLQYVLVETDITSLKEQQQEIQDSEIKLNAFFSSTTSLHMLVDHNLKVMAFNKIAEDFVWSTMNTNIAERDYLPPKLPETAREDFINFATEALKGNPTSNRQTSITYNGTTLTWTVNYLPARDRNGNIIGCAFTAVDITDRKKAEDKINRQNAQLKEVAWKQSHIVRAPLANILAIATLLQNNGSDAGLLAALTHETEKLDDIIRDIVSKTIEVKNEC